LLERSIDSSQAINGGNVVVSQFWANRTFGYTTVIIPVTAGSHTVKLEYYDNLKNARVLLMYAATTPPPPVLSTTPLACPDTLEWKAEYWSNMEKFSVTTLASSFISLSAPQAVTAAAAAAVAVAC
jgi:hypothetical protein